MQPITQNSRPSFFVPLVRFGSVWATAVVLGLAPAARATTTTVNFETEPSLSTQPSTFALAGAEHTYSKPGVYTISGGVALGNPGFLASFPTQGSAPNLYGTTDIADPSLLDTVTLTFALSSFTTSVQGVLFNGQAIAEDYMVTAYTANNVPVGSQSFMQIPDSSSTNSFALFSLTSTVNLPITMVTVTTPNAGTNGWDFFVDNVQIMQGIPEPSSLALLAGGGAALLALGSWRRRKMTAHRSRQSAVPCVLLAVAVLGLGFGRSASATWVEQGPGPIKSGTDGSLTATHVSPNNDAVGAVTALAGSPANADLLYAATANGGVWKTTNATAASPTWVPLTDQALPGLSISSLAISPLDPNTLFAGTGSTSASNSDGVKQFGVARSTDGGVTWAVLGAATFQSEGPIINIAPTAINAPRQVVLAITPNDTFRSSDGGNTWTNLSGFFGAPVPRHPTSLVGDPASPGRFYIAFPQFDFNFMNNVYRTEDAGATWTQMSFRVSGINPNRMLLAVGKNTGTLFALAISSNGDTSNAGVIRSTDRGATWTSMGAPSPEMFPGAQGFIHGAIVADPDNTNVVYVSGDRQDTPFPNANGATDYTGNVFRGDAALLPSYPWQNVVSAGANNTSPHPDSRSMMFDPNGRILHTCDGGIYALVNPATPATRVWVSLNGNLRPTEMYSVAYDPLSKVVFGGAQDNGTSIQDTPGGISWTAYQGGDGAVVGVDADQTAHPGTTIRYSSSQYLLGFQRSTWSATNTFISRTFLPVSFGGTQPFVTRYVINPIAPNRILLGTGALGQGSGAIYESTNQGDSFTAFPPGSSFLVTALTYGSRLNGVDKPAVFYVGTSSGSPIKHRVNAGDPVSDLSYPGGGVIALAMDPQNYQKVYVVDDKFGPSAPAHRIWASFNEGVSWTNLTANLTSLCGDVRTIEVFSPTSGIKDTVLIAGGAGGIFQMRRPGSAGASWTPLSMGLPHALFTDMHYNYADNVLVAGALGRGVWTLTNFFRGGGGSGLDSTTAPAPAALALPTAPADSSTIRTMPWQPPTPMEAVGSASGAPHNFKKVPRDPTPRR